MIFSNATDTKAYYILLCFGLILQVYDNITNYKIGRMESDKFRMVNIKSPF